MRRLRRPFASTPVALAAAAATLLFTALAPPAAEGADYLGSVGRLGETPGSFFRIEDVATDAKGYLYVLDSFLNSDGRVTKLTGDGKVVRQWGRSPDESERGDNDQVPNLLYYPQSLAIGPDGNVYVAEQGSDRTRISVWSPTGQFLRAFGSGGSGTGQFTRGSGMTFDPRGRLVVADGDRLVLFNQNGTPAGAITMAEGATSFPDATDVAVGPDGLLYVTDVASVAVYDLNGGFVGFFGDRGDAPGALFQDDESLAFAGTTLYVSDRALSRVQAFGTRGAFLGPVGVGPGSQAAQFTEPGGLATDCRGRLYVADFGNARVQRFGTKGLPECGSVAGDPSERFVASLGGAAIQDFREEFAVRPGVGCGRPCTAIISGKVTIAGARRKITLETERRSLEFPGLAVVNLAPSERGTDQILAALRRKKRVTASVRFTGRDLTGRITTKVRSYRLR